MNYAQAQQELERIDRVLDEWHAKRLIKQSELSKLEAEGPTLILKGELTTEEYARRREQLRDEIGATDGVLSAVQSQRPAAERDVKVARIADLREQADKLEAGAQPIIKRREELLAELEALEGKHWQTEGRSILLISQAQRLRDAARDAEVKLQHPDTAERDDHGNEIRRVARRAL